jgi:poly-gamma-glutamate synthesis protein (capsule biosynthesis protein)
MFNTPDSYSEALRDAGVNLMSTANNHTNDKREAGIIRTLDVLDELGIGSFGSFRTQEERDTIFVVNEQGIRIAFLAYSYSTNGIPLTAGKPYLMNLLDEQLIRADVAAARALNVDLVVIYAHMGDEYTHVVRPVWQRWYEIMLDAGADIVVSAHPHVLQPFEYRPETGQFIAYSLSNFISSMRRTADRNVSVDAGVILNIEITKDKDGTRITQVSYIPTWVMMVNDRGQWDIRVMSVYDGLNDKIPGLRESDKTALWRVHNEVSEMYLGYRVAREDIQNEYVFWSEN